MTATRPRRRTAAELAAQEPADLDIAAEYARTRKPATTTDIVPRSPFGRHDTAAGLIWRAQVASAPSVVQVDWDAFDDALASYAADEDDGREAARKQADAAHQVVNSGRDVRDRYDGHAYQAAYTGTMTGCGDEPWVDPVAALGIHEQGPGDPAVDAAIAGIAERHEKDRADAERARFRPAAPSNVRVIKPSAVADGSEPPSFELDPEAEKHMTEFLTAHEGHPDCPGREEPEPAEPVHEPALDEADPLPVDDQKTGSDEESAQS